MSRLAKWKGKTALVTGASSGIGMEMARLLAAAGCHLILVARREERLFALARELESENKINADVLSEDLSEAESADRLIESIDGLGKEVDLLINNAGAGIGGDFTDSHWSAQQSMLQLNIMTLAALTHKLLPAMLKRGSGDILLVSSGVAYTPMPGFTTYGASKAFVTYFGQSLGSELAGTGVSVTVLHPGATESEFWSTAGYQLNSVVKVGLMSSQRVARIGLKAAAAGRRSIVAGFFNTIGTWLLKWIPLSIRLWGAKRGMKMVGELTKD